ncbi:MAG TPA: aminoacetone oxidase family FAD-binding enzyme [Lachnospiraceae bacterium]|nr:aminoacetone oxidase family FAD-binding enzyme [Lachnospiraceae bacterium]
MREIVIIGGGAAGMFASLYASGPGNRVHVFEKNDRLGRKLFITGKGRCNLTNDCGQEQFLASVMSNGKFLYSAYAGFSNQDVVELFHALGVRTKVERGNRVFPQSDHSSDIIRALERRMKELNVRIHLKSTVAGLRVSEGKVTGVVLENGAVIPADAVLVATGGLSYPVTGSTGDGFFFAEEEGLKVTERSPSLVPMETEEEYITDMQGLSLRNVELCLRQKGKVLFREFGEMLFTHFGISGPLVLTASARVGKNLTKGPLQGEIDLKPALDAEQLDRRILRDFEANKNRQFKNVIGGLLPSKLIPPVLSLSAVSGDTPVHGIGKKDRQAFGHLLKAFPFTVTGLRGYDEAIITRGGVSVREIDPRTMEAKKVSGLYFAGEVLDVDALTGGFNLQIAWSTAHAAGIHMGSPGEK